MANISKKRARPNDDPDPVGLLPALHAKLTEAYQAQLRVFLRKFLLVKLAPAVLRSILDAATTQGGPVSFDLRITVYPRNEWGFFRVVGALKTPSADLRDEDRPDAPEDEPYVDTLFGKRVPASLLKTGRRRGGRGR